MRIIGGRFRGRKLMEFRGGELRPTGDRLREALFNILGSGIVGSLLLDIFSGTGAVGLEAVSRGAREVVFIERDPDANRLIRRNLQRCGVENGYQLIKGDAFTALRQLGRSELKPDFIFLDPPYRWNEYGDLLKIIFRRGLAHSETWVVVEHHRRAALPESGDGFRRFRQLRQGNHYLSFYIGHVDTEIT
jgi:16S rRNA (guanine(966)-N(2))-methyltransferase RsmD